MNTCQTLHLCSRKEWRRWLSKHYKSKDGIWLVFHRKSSGEPTIEYDQAVEEAICFGWIDVQIRRIDGHKHMRRFTPRRQRSNWSDSNKRRALRMLREGKMTGAGRSVLPPDVLSYGRSKAETQPKTEPTKAAVAGDMKFCRNCGAKLLKENKFCGSFGTH
jgi:hypothetical protein